MEKTIVIYQSKTGYTKKYAEWIAAALKCDLMDRKEIKVEQLEQYSTIIFGGYIMADKITGLELVKKDPNIMKQKKVIVFACGLTPADGIYDQKVFETNFTEEERKEVSFFYYQGGMDLSKQKGFSKILLKMILKKMIKQIKEKPNPTESDRKMLGVMEHPVDFTDQKKIKDLIASARGTV